MVILNRCHVWKRTFGCSSRCNISNSCMDHQCVILCSVKSNKWAKVLPSLKRSRADLQRTLLSGFMKGNEWAETRSDVIRSLHHFRGAGKNSLCVMTWKFYKADCHFIANNCEKQLLQNEKKNILNPFELRDKAQPPPLCQSGLMKESVTEAEGWGGERRGAQGDVHSIIFFLQRTHSVLTPYASAQTLPEKGEGKRNVRTQFILLLLCQRGNILHHIYCPELTECDNWSTKDSDKSHVFTVARHISA